MRFEFAGDGNCIHFFKIIRDAIKQPRYAPSFQNFEWPWYMPGVAEYEALVKGFPFIDARVWGQNADRYFADEAAMMRWIDQPSLVPFLSYLGPQDKLAFRELVVKQMLAATREPDGKCFETFRRINVSAQKA